jgi:hypothetical protein
MPCEIRSHVVKSHIGHFYANWQLFPTEYLTGNGTETSNTREFKGGQRRLVLSLCASL